MTIATKKYNSLLLFNLTFINVQFSLSISVVSVIPLIYSKVDNSHYPLFLLRLAISERNYYLIINSFGKQSDRYIYIYT